MLQNAWLNRNKKLFSFVRCKDSEQIYDGLDYSLVDKVEEAANDETSKVDLER